METILNTIQFANPRLLWLLLLLLPLIAYYIYRTRQGGATILISTTDTLAGANKTLKYYLRHVPFALRCLALAAAIIALARPQSTEYESSSTTRGIDIVLSIDVSGSMLARDFRPNRITAARETASKFIADRSNDRIGIVVFAGESFTLSPLTTDKRTLLTQMGQVRSGVIDDGTAIGNGLATAINRLRESDAKSKVAILLTDGVNNAGEIAPMTAAEIALEYGIKVYTIGIGTRGMADYPAYDRWGRLTYVPQKVEIDEEILRGISAKTSGEYFRATDNSSLKEVYDRINQLEKTEIETSDLTRYNELFATMLLAALVLLILEFLVNKLWLKRIP